MPPPVPASAHPGVEAAYAHLSLLTRGQTTTLAGATWFPDISQFQGPVNWGAMGAAYRAGALAAVAIRASYGTVSADAQFAANQRGVRAQGIPAIYYHFAYPAYNQPAAEAAFFNEVVGPLQANEAQGGDFEDDPAAKPFPRGQAGLDWCRAFLSALRAPQNASWWYTYPFLLGAVGLQSLIGAWPFWEADYSATPDGAFAPAIARQFTDCGSTPGVGGCCDQSRILRGPLAQWLTPGGPMSWATTASDGDLVELFHLMQSEIFGIIDPSGQDSFVAAVRSGVAPNTIGDGWRAMAQAQAYQAARQNLVADDQKLAHLQASSTPGVDPAALQAALSKLAADQQAVLAALQQEQADTAAASQDPAL